MWKTQEKHNREQFELVKVNNLWAAQRKFLIDHSHLTQEVPEKTLLEEFWAGVLEVNGLMNERDPNIQGWEEELEDSLADLQPVKRFYLN